MVRESQKILLIDDSLEKRQSYGELLSQTKKYNYQIFEAQDIEEGLKLSQEIQPDLILWGYKTLKGNNLANLVKLNPNFLSKPTILIIPQACEKIGSEAIARGALDYLIEEKLTDLGLCRAVAHGIERARLLQTIQATQERLRLVNDIALRIRRSLSLQDILKVTVTEVRKLLGCDRVIVYQVHPDWNREVLAESVAPGWQSLRENQENRIFCGQYVGKEDGQIKPQAIANIYEARLSKEHIERLERCQVKAKLVIPLILKSELCNDDSSQEGSLWGFLVVHQCSKFRFWQPSEAQLLEELGTQITIAIQQATLVEQLRSQLEKRRQVEEELRQVNQIQQAILDSTDYAIVSVNRDGIIQTVNRGTERIFGYQAEELIGKVTPAIFHDREEIRQEAKMLSEQLGKTIEPGLKVVLGKAIDEEIEEKEWTLIRKDGSRFPALLTVEPLRNLQGDITGFVGIGKNISDRKQAEALQKRQLAHLMEWQNRYRAVNQTSGQIIYEWDSRDHLMIWGINIQEILGYPGDKLPHRLENWRDIIHPDDRENFITELDRCHNLKIPFQAEYRVSRQDGTYLWVEDRNQTFANYEGELVRVVGLLRDISPYKEFELKIRELNQNLEQKALELKIANRELNYRQNFINSVLNAVSDPLVVKDRHHRWILVNDSLCQLIGLSREELIGKHDSDIFSPEQAVTYWQQDRLVLESGKTHQYEQYFLDSAGQVRFLSSKKIRFFDQEGNPYLVAFTRDLTEKKQDEKQLKENLCLSKWRLEISNVLTQVSYLPESLQQCAQSFVTHLDVAFARIWLFDEAEHQLQLRASAGIYTHLNGAHSRIKLGEYKVGKIAESRCPIVTNMVMTDDHIRDREWAKKEGMVAFAGYPMTIDDKLIGVLAMFSRQTLSEKVIEEIGAIANLIALGIERHHQAEVLRQREQRYRQIVETAKEGIWLIDPLARTSYCNPQMAAMIGYSFEEMQGRSLYDFMDIAARQSAAQYFQRRQEGIEETHDFRFIRKDGSPVWAMIAAAPMFDDQGQFQGALGMVTDITARKKAEEQLRQSEERFRQLAENINEVFYVSDLQHPEMFYVSPAYESIWGRSRQSLYDNPYTFIQAIHPEDRQRVIDALDRQQRGEKTREKYRILQPNGEMRWVWDRSFPLQDELGNIYRVCGVVEDITEQQAVLRERNQTEAQLLQTNEQLAQINQQLERVNRLKDEFLASMSHELRTPLNSIIGLSEALKTQVYGSLTEAQNQSLTTIERSGQHLLALINDILDLAKIESGKMELEIAPISVSQLCHSSLALVRQQAQQENIELDYQIPKGIQPLQGDEKRLRQVLINLLSNAVKFTPNGGKVSLVVENLAPEGKLAFRIIDTGIGIPTEKFELLFQSFVQLDSSLSRRYTGTGLGLALVRSLTEMHGGTVSVESQVGVGSQFTVLLPYQGVSSHHWLENQGKTQEPPSDTLMAIAPYPSVEPPLILVADDNNDNIETLWEYLLARGYRLIRAHNGLEIITLAQERQPDAILMDIQMPKMDGLEATRRLKANRDTRLIPIIIVTAMAMPGDRDKGLAAGADEYITKPMSLKKLCDTIDGFLNNAP